MITIVGLGVERGDLTKKGEQAIFAAVQKGATVVVRTANTHSYQTVLDLNIPHVCLDDVYKRCRNFNTLAKKLAKAVADYGENTVYLVDGSANEDYSAKALVKRLRGKVEIIDGVSKITSLARLAAFDGCSYTALSAYELFNENRRLSLPLLVYDLDDKGMASDVKLKLDDFVGAETQVRYIQNGKAKKISLYDLDRQKHYDYATAVAIEEIGLLDKRRFDLKDLTDIVVRLRRPDGCPWDKVQTNDSIKMSAVEEAYELVDAIDCGDDDKILEETGDLILQTAFHAVMKEEIGAFNMTDVLTGICEKLIFRHSHVFGNDKATDGDSALSVWEKNKMTEKGQDTFAKSVNDVPKCFPAAMRAQKVGKRAAKAGLDFVGIDDAAQHLQEELQEFFTAYNNGNKDECEKELGDLLFAAVNIGRKAGCDCEKALKESVERFAKRFTLAEAKALQDGKTVTKLSAKEWDNYYRSAKAELAKK